MAEIQHIVIVFHQSCYKAYVCANDFATLPHLPLTNQEKVLSDGSLCSGFDMRENTDEYSLSAGGGDQVDLSETWKYKVHLLWFLIPPKPEGFSPNKTK